jgi:hypothetical protein
MLDNLPARVYTPAFFDIMNGMTHGIRDKRAKLHRPRKCDECGKLFTPERYWQRYHSVRCGNRARARKRAGEIKRALEMLRETEVA